MCNFRINLLVLLLAGTGIVHAASGEILLSEIMYHPVERPAFDSNGVPVLDVTCPVMDAGDPTGVRGIFPKLLPGCTPVMTVAA